MSRRLSLWKKTRLILSLWLLLGVVGVPRWSLPAVYAAEFTPGCDVTQLIADINTANTTPEPDIIILAIGCTYELTSIDNNTDGNNGLPSITTPITINGNGATISRNSDDAFRLLHVAADANLTLNNLALINGLIDSDPARGGAIYNLGTLTLNEVTVTGNAAQSDSEAMGGGIYSEGTVGASVLVTITDSTIEQNEAEGYDGSEGGGIYTWNTQLTITGSQIQQNDITSELDGRGGGIAARSSQVQLQNTQVIENEMSGAWLEGGGIYSSDTILQVQFSTISQNDVTGQRSTSFEIGGQVKGGGIYGDSGAVTLEDSVVSANAINGGYGIGSKDGGDAEGGGIYTSGAALTLERTTVSGNTATGGDAGDGPDEAWGGSAYGGGIYHGGGTFTLRNSTISDNTATAGRGGDNTAGRGGNGGSVRGGGLYLSQSESDGTSTLFNSTISGNNGTGARAGTGSSAGDDSEVRGGGIYISTWYSDPGDNQIILNHVTITDNRVATESSGDARGGGVFVFGFINVPVTVQNSIIAGNSGATGSDCTGRPLISADYNLIGHLAGCTLNGVTTNNLSGDALLDPLALNVPGTTSTHALQSTSPALNHIPAGTNGCGTTVVADQRGVVRPQGSGCDIGAYELLTLLELLAENDAVETDEDQPLIIAVSDLLANDSTHAVFQSFTQPTHGTLVNNGNGTLTYTPNADYYGDDSFTYTIGSTEVTDPATTSATVQITIHPVNDAPSFTPGGDVTINSMTGPQTIINWAQNMLPGPPNEATQTLTFALTVSSTTGDLAFSVPPAINPATGTLTFTPAPGTSGSATVQVILRDDGGTERGGVDRSEPATFTITFVVVPLVAQDDAVETDEDQPLIIAVSDLLANDSTHALFQTFTQPTHGTLVDNGNGTLTYTPDSGYHGSDSFTYTIGSTQATVPATTSATVRITIRPVDAPPPVPLVAQNDAVETDEDQPLIIAVSDLLANDSTHAVFQSFTQPTHGTLVNNGDGTLTYTPDSDYYGDDQFTYTIGSTQATVPATTSATVWITVWSVNDPPSFTPGVHVRLDNTTEPQTIPNWARNISPGPPNEAHQKLTFVLEKVVALVAAAPAANGDLAFSVPPAIDPTTGTLTFTPEPGTSGSVTLQVILYDDGGTDRGGVNRSPAHELIITVTFPTALDLLRFTATDHANGMLIAWETSSERDTWGFHLWRSVDGQRSNAVRITATPIVARGRKTSGATYSWLDTDVEPGKRYTYWLEEIENSGIRRMYGPASSVSLTTQHTVFLPLVRR